MPRGGISKGPWNGTRNTPVLEDENPHGFPIFFSHHFFSGFFFGDEIFSGVSSRGTFPISLIVPSGKLTLAMEDGPGLSRCIPY